MTKRAHHERVLSEVFPHAGTVVFDTKTKGFVPLPIEFRLLLRHLKLPEVRVLIYLYTRANKEGLCFPTVDEVAHELGVTKKHLPTHMKELERKGFIQSGSKSGRTYYLVHDPAIAIQRLVELGEMNAEQLRDINGLREDIGHDPVEAETRR